MENQYNEKNTMKLVEAWDDVAPSASEVVGIAMNTRAILVQNVLLSQISESLAILANNTRLIQEKESK
jgi:hypothetical protein